MKQTRFMSLVEILTNLGTGFLLASMINHLVLPLWGYNIPIGESFQIAFLFTVVSIIRSYMFRRIFEFVRVRNG